MKPLYLALGLFAIQASLSAQDSLLYITTAKTASIIFPAVILHVDRGHADILVQQVPAAGNVLLVKAAQTELEESSLSVLTNDGRLYSFVVRYETSPRQMVYQPGNPVVFDRSRLEKGSLETTATMILDNPRRRGHIRKVRWGMALQLDGIYSQGAVLFLHFSLTNDSPIDYDLEYLKLYIRDGKGRRRTAVQEKELHPLEILGSYQQVKGRGRARFVLALPKFTIPEAQYLALEMGEENGGRHLAVKIRNRHLLNAALLPPASFSITPK